MKTEKNNFEDKEAIWKQKLQFKQDDRQNKGATSKQYLQKRGERWRMERTLTHSEDTSR